MSFLRNLEASARLVEDRLALHLRLEGAPMRLAEAMRYAVLGGGKRLRPFLLIECARLFDVKPESAADAAAALECVHCYSLVHDDLPAMDDDDLRRGQPTVHIAFDEATAILAGDALLTLAFAILASPDTHADPALRAALAQGLARASGPLGMAGGQALDLEAEGKLLDEAAIRHMQDLKTGALIAFACEAGAMLGRAKQSERDALKSYGRALGKAFQLADDLLDAEGDAGLVGKATRKDTEAGKATLVAVLGVKRARALLDDFEARAVAHLEPFGARAETLREAARFVTRRGY